MPIEYRLSTFKVRSFDRFAQKYGISNEELLKAAESVVAGNADADLGGGVSTHQLASALRCGALIKVEDGNDQDKRQEQDP